MDRQMYVFDAELVGFEGVQRAIAVREDLTLVDLHYALQSALGWDDDHLYAFWLQGGFWPQDEDPFVHPQHAATEHAHGRSACAPLRELALAPGQRISYVFDFAREWRVQLTVRAVEIDTERRSPRLLEAAGAPPPQYAALAVRA
ncbi:MAG: hypothetical protein QOE11_1804 [Solirubrobacteraceae bacterium]|jgi:hypothetical protein|nr:hypothetical protein [Solirubrobacteraceae bacterium]